MMVSEKISITPKVTNDDFHATIKLFNEVITSQQKTIEKLNNDNTLLRYFNNLKKTIDIDKLGDINDLVVKVYMVKCVKFSTNIIDALLENNKSKVVYGLNQYETFYRTINVGSDGFYYSAQLAEIDAKFNNEIRDVIKHNIGNIKYEIPELYINSIINKSDLFDEMYKSQDKKVIDVFNKYISKEISDERKYNHILKYREMLWNNLLDYDNDISITYN